jgi:hypothetical protein
LFWTVLFYSSYLNTKYITEGFLGSSWSWECPH